MNYHVFESEDIKLNLLFSEEELRDFKELWKAGISVENMAKKLRRKPSEIVLLVFDHAERGLIKNRQQGVYGL